MKFVYIFQTLLLWVVLVHSSSVYCFPHWSCHAWIGVSCWDIVLVCFTRIQYQNGVSKCQLVYCNRCGNVFKCSLVSRGVVRGQTNISKHDPKYCADKDWDSTPECSVIPQFATAGAQVKIFLWKRWKKIGERKKGEEFVTMYFYFLGRHGSGCWHRCCYMSWSEFYVSIEASDSSP